MMIACAITAVDVVSAHMASAHTDTCSNQIVQLEELVSHWMGSPAAKPTVPQSIDAQLHHQPTPDSVQRAEETANLKFASILARAKILNADGKIPECIESVMEALRLLGIKPID
jgi:hypothetical protein